MDSEKNEDFESVVPGEPPTFTCAYCGTKLVRHEQYGFENVPLKWAICFDCFKKVADNLLKV